MSATQTNTIIEKYNSVNPMNNHQHIIMCTRQFTHSTLCLDLDFGSGEGHISIHSRCRTTCRPNHVTVALRSTEIWPFECR